MLTHQKGLGNRIESSFARHQKKSKRAVFQVIVARFYVGQPKGKRLWSTAEKCYNDEYTEAVAACRRLGKREIPDDLKQRILDDVKQGKRIDKAAGTIRLDPLYLVPVRVGKSALQRRK